MSDLDLDAIVTQAQLAVGESPSVLMARARSDEEAAGIARLASMTESGREDRRSYWTGEELEFVRENLGRLSFKEIGKALGRSANAIKIVQVREGFRAPSKRPNSMSARATADLLGMCCKKIKRLIREGRMPGHLIPGKAGIHIVYRHELLRWLVNPNNWVYVVDVERITDPGIRSLVKRRMEQWDDEWWTTGQAGRYHGVTPSLVNKHLREGRLPGVRWQNWRIRRSDAVKARFQTGRGKHSLLNWSVAGDAFLVLGSAVGLPMAALDHLRGDGHCRAHYRLTCLHKRGQIKRLIAVYALNVTYHEGGDTVSACLFADWRDHAGRFPGLVQAIRRFHSGRKLTAVDSLYLRGLLHRWGMEFADTGERRAFARPIIQWQKARRETLADAYEELLSWGIDPLGGDCVPV